MSTKTRREAVRSGAPISRDRVADRCRYEGSPYCRLVREQLDAYGLSYVSRNLARESPRREAFLERFGKLQFPCLYDPNDERSLFETESMLKHVQSLYLEAKPGSGRKDADMQPTDSQLGPMPDQPLSADDEALRDRCERAAQQEYPGARVLVERDPRGIVAGVVLPEDGADLEVSAVCSGAQP